MSRQREAPEVAGAAARLMRALARRAGEGELEALEALRDMQITVGAYLALAVEGYRDGPAQASWTDIGEIMGTSRQAAQHRWGER